MYFQNISDVSVDKLASPASQYGSDVELEWLCVLYLAI